MKHSTSVFESSWIFQTGLGIKVKRKSRFLKAFSKAACVCQHEALRTWDKQQTGVRETQTLTSQLVFMSISQSRCVQRLQLVFSITAIRSASYKDKHSIHGVVHTYNKNAQQIIISTIRFFVCFFHAISVPGYAPPQACRSFHCRQ